MAHFWNQRRGRAAFEESVNNFKRQNIRPLRREMQRLKEMSSISFHQWAQEYGYSYLSGISRDAYNDWQADLIQRIQGLADEVEREQAILKRWIKEEYRRRGWGPVRAGPRHSHFGAAARGPAPRPAPRPARPAAPRPARPPAPRQGAPRPAAPRPAPPRPAPPRPAPPRPTIQGPHGPYLKDKFITKWYEEGNCKAKQELNNVHICRGKVALMAYHPDKNKNCPETANELAKIYQSYCTQEGAGESSDTIYIGSKTNPAVQAIHKKHYTGSKGGNRKRKTRRKRKQTRKNRRKRRRKRKNTKKNRK